MILLLGVGWLVHQSYNMVSYAMSEATKKKIQFISDGKAWFRSSYRLPVIALYPVDKAKIRAKLLEYIDEDQIPRRYGGTGQAVPGEVGAADNGKGWSNELVEEYLKQDVYLSSPNDPTLPLYS